MKHYTPHKYNEKSKIQCPYCNNYIPRASKHCPFCGTCLTELEQDPAIKNSKVSVRIPRNRYRVPLQHDAKIEEDAIMNSIGLVQILRNRHHTPLQQDAKKEEDYAMLGTILIMMVFELILFYIVKTI